MAKYFEFQTRKMLSAYGGVGSILETPKGAIIIEEFDKWLFFSSEKKPFLNPDFTIEDTRLFRRLKQKFPKLERLVGVPVTIRHPHVKFEAVPAESDKITSGRYFPKWMYCNNCDRFMPFEDWWEGWKVTFKGGEPRNYFIPPKCWHCYQQAEQSKDKKKKKFHELEQVRFVMTSPGGDICDVPWDRWTLAEKNISEDDAEQGNIRLNWERLCCEKQDLRYLKSTKFSDFAGVRVECANCGQRNTLAGLFGLRIKRGESLYKPVIRTSNSVYYPLVINSLYLPSNDEILPADQEKIRRWVEKGKDASFIFDALEERYLQSSIVHFLRSISACESESIETETQYRRREYRFLLENLGESKNLVCEEQDAGLLRSFHIQRLVKIKRLKMTTVQTGYTRQEPMDKDLFMQLDGNSNSNGIRVRYTSKQGLTTPWLPAVESFGEGIFFALEPGLLNDWLEQNLVEGTILNKQAETTLQRIYSNEILASRYLSRFSERKFMTKFTLLHTKSHLIIKELEFLCGYPATSLQERLYIDNEEMCGVLIYTVAGSEGSYGGLIRQAEPKAFQKILASAMHRALDCASDPVCFHSDGQGIGGLNFAACYSCALLPETSCEEFNSFLDRKLVVGEIGFIARSKE